MADIVLHLGFALLALGVVGSRSLAESTVVSLSVGQNAVLSSRQVTKTSAQVEESVNQQVLYAEEYEFHPAGKRYIVLQPHILWYEDTRSTVSAPDIHSNFLSDTYAAILEWDGTSNGSTTVLLAQFPLMVWLWVGGVLLILGTLRLHFSPPHSEDEK